jgi:acetyl-CoA carboxylase biotin carboxyl carrier protein
MMIRESDWPAVRNQNLTYEDVLRIVELVKTTQFREFRLKVGEIEVHLRRSNGAAPPELEAPVTAPSPTPSRAAIPPARHAAGEEFPDGSVLVRAPMVGTFYRAPAPDAAPFVEVGQHVEPGTTVGIIEVMKLMNSIAAEARGLVTRIVAENGKPVEYGEVLLVIRPDPEDG